MKEGSYRANYDSALSYLKLGLKESALEALERALSQVPHDEVHENNEVYLGILSALSVLHLEMAHGKAAVQYVEQGLKVKRNHPDFLFMQSLFLMDARRYDEMLESLLHYLLAIEEPGVERFNSRYASESAIAEVFNNLLPLAYKNAFEYAAIRGITERLSKVTANKGLMKALEIMTAVDAVRSTLKN